MRAAGLALAVRALRLDMRSPGRGWQRVGLVLLLIAALAWIRTAGSFAGAPGQVLVGWLLFVDAGAIALLAIGTFSAVIAEEKEQMTLGLLRLAGFGPVPLLAGKSVGELCTALLLLAVQVPFALLGVTLGGVSPEQVAAGYAVLGAFLLAAYAIALCASVVCARTRTAGALTTAVLLAWWLAPALLAPVLLWAGGAPAAVREAVELLWSLSVWSGVFGAIQVGFDAGQVLDVVVAHLAVAAVAAMCAWLAFERFNREEREAAESRGWLRRRRSTTRSRPQAGIDAVFWKDFHFVAGGRAGFAGRILGYGLLFAVVASSLRGSGGTGSASPAVVAAVFAGWCTFFFALDCGSLAARLFQTEIQWRTLPSLALLPHALTAIAYRKAGACLVALLPGGLSLFFAATTSDLGQGALLGCSFIGALMVLGAHLAAYFSIVRARSVFALALAIAGVFTWVAALWFLAATCLFRAGGDENWIWLMVVATLGVAALVHRRIGPALAAAAAR